MGRDETPRRSGARDLERYAGLFAQRTQAMKSSAMRDLMAVTAQPEFRGQGLFAESTAFLMLLFWIGCITMSRESQRLERRLGVGTR